VSDITCQQVQHSAAEFALGIAAVEERAAIAAHLLRCAQCRTEIVALSTVASRLFDLVPGTEPPLGFDQRVLRHVAGRRRPRRSWRVMAGAAAAAILLVFGTLGWFIGQGGSHPQSHVLLAAAFRQAGRTIGEVDLDRDGSPWVSMFIRHSDTSGTVTCQLVYRNGHVMPLGSFDVVGGNGSWSAPDTAGAAGVTGVRLVDNHGRTVATANFT
jgi:hypothetical protein